MQTKSKPWTEEEVDFLKKNYETSTWCLLLSKLDRTKSSIEAKVHKIGLKTRRNQIINQEYGYYNDFFNIPNVLNSYAAGLIMADGYVPKNKPRKIVVKLQATDKNYLQKFSELMCSKARLHYVSSRNHKTGTISHGYYLEMSNLQFRNDLEYNFGIDNITKKSCTSIFPRHLSKENKLAFLVGLIDGDGTIRYNKSRQNRFAYLNINICGGEKLMRDIKCFLNSIGISSSVYAQKLDENNNETIQIYICSIMSKFAYKLFKIIDKIECLRPYRMKRKWDRIDGYRH